MRGRALAFEGTVSVEVRQDGDRRPIGTGFVAGGGDVARPLDGEIDFEAPTAAMGAIVLFTESAEDGRRWQAVAVRVGFSSSGAIALCAGWGASDFREWLQYGGCEKRRR